MIRNEKTMEISTNFFWGQHYTCFQQYTRNILLLLSPALVHLVRSSRSKFRLKNLLGCSHLKAHKNIRPCFLLIQQLLFLCEYLAHEPQMLYLSMDFKRTNSKQTSKSHLPYFKDCTILTRGLHSLRPKTKASTFQLYFTAPEVIFQWIIFFRGRRGALRE